MSFSYQNKGQKQRLGIYMQYFSILPPLPLVALPTSQERRFASRSRYGERKALLCSLEGPKRKARSKAKGWAVGGRLLANVVRSGSFFFFFNTKKTGGFGLSPRSCPVFFCESLFLFFVSKTLDIYSFLDHSEDSWKGTALNLVELFGALGVQCQQVKTREDDEWFA